MRYSSQEPHEILKTFRDEGYYPLAFPVYWDHEEAVICRSVPMSSAARTLAEHENGMIRALYAVHMIRRCKREAARLADAAGVHLAL